MTYHAHSAPPGGKPQTVKEHLTEVARRAREFAEPFGAGDEAELAGLLHDIGKYTDLFKARLDGEEHHLDHWSTGAWIAAARHEMTAAALAIAGHHLGLPPLDDWLEPPPLAELDGAPPQRFRVTATDPDLVLRRLAADVNGLPQPASSTHPGCIRHGAAMLDVRMLYSALVDADFLDTERHFGAQRPPGVDLQPAEALSRLERCVSELTKSADCSEAVRDLRTDLWGACLRAADGKPGLYTLSAPTGAGKTLAMLRFALRHAVSHANTDPRKPPRFRRVVMVVPYLSIIDQTVKEYRRVFEREFGSEYVLEHHSLAGTRRETAPEGGLDADAESKARQRARQLGENWDAPLIVTTSVQFLESLFASRASACRKLHNLANSIVLFDEVQTLPLSLAVPTLATLSHLSKRYGATVVFATATQPAFDHLHDHVYALGRCGWRPQEVTAAVPDLFSRAGQIRPICVEWPRADEHLAWDKLADLLAAQTTQPGEGDSQALCIVNLKRHAQILFELLRDRGVPNLRHLSTNLCPAHRERVLDDVRGWLDPRSPQPCCLVATQCIEAGVDVDFPVVYRAFAPLDAIAQAAGRCNRHGLRPKGRVVVFHPDDDQGLYPTPAYAQAAAVAAAVLADWPREPLLTDRDLYDTYYRRLYDTARPESLRGPLREAIESQDFPKVAEEYRLIDKDGVNLLVLYAPAKAEVESLGAEVRRNGLTAAWVLRARPYAVNIYRPGEDVLRSGYLEPVRLRGKEGKGDAQDWFLCLDAKCYHEHLGIKLPPGLRCLIE